ncbi:MAG TPA: hypothetical protein VG225_06270 [Terracidiphilus sp.]|jgi:hypothetical protein|nr:hypothetical protein [Terracidiphilus sp.]
MSIPRNPVLACFGVLALSIPALAGVTVNSPVNDTSVSSPFKLSATATSCSSESVVSMGYSFDSSSDTTVVKAQSIDTSVSSSTGKHTLHVKAWGSNSSCVTDVAIDVTSSTSSTSTTSSEIPSYAVKVSSIESLSGWKATHDSGGPGTSTGSMSLVSSPSLYGSSRRYVTSFTNSGDERYSVSFADDVDSKNFFYDAWVYLTSSSSKLGNLEFDVNQVMANGQTVLVGVQCDGYTGHWAYTVNKGTASDVKPSWVSKSGTSCNPRSWSQYKWHHVQFSFYRSDSGTITYHSIWLDGVESTLDATAFGAADLGWGPTIMTQFQVDGLGSSGTVTAYVDNLTISRW